MKFQIGLLASISTICLSSIAMADRTWLDSSAYGGPEEYLQKQVDPATSPDADLPSSEVLATLYRTEVELSRAPTSEYEAKFDGKVMRTFSKMYDDDPGVWMHFTFDRNRLKCFSSGDLIRCITMMGVRKKIFPEDDIETLGFMYFQREYILRKEGDDLTVVELCYDTGECGAVRRAP